MIAPLVAFAAQFVGLSMNLLRSTLTSIERMSSLTPPKTLGIGSETALIWAVSGFTLSATRTTTVPRSNGPADGGVITAIESGAPSYGPAR